MRFIIVLFRKQKKKLPSFLLKLPFGDCFRYGIFIAGMAWLLQGIRYMDRHEAILKILIDVIGVVLGWLLGINLFLAWGIVHTLNFCFNGQLFAMFTHMGANGVAPDFFLSETMRCAAQLSKYSCISCALAFGSLARGEYKQTSDIDLRIVPASGEWNFWKCTLLALWMRNVAFIRNYPLDLYVFSLPVLIGKMRTDEPPVLLTGTKNGLDKIYPSIVTINDFEQIFRQKQLKAK